MSSLALGIPAALVNRYSSDHDLFVRRDSMQIKNIKAPPLQGGASNDFLDLSKEQFSRANRCNRNSPKGKPTKPRAFLALSCLLHYFCRWSGGAFLDGHPLARPFDGRRKRTAKFLHSLG
jgi:hypothetical protein